MWERAPEKAGELVISSLTPVIVHKLGINTLISLMKSKIGRPIFDRGGGRNPQNSPLPKINTKKVLK